MQTQNEESPFAFEELFFSMTDNRGIITAGNEIFCRVAEMDWSELNGKPHNIIRHPDMPRGVFYLLWEYLKAKKPIGAFVKNRSKTGKYYWVFALAMPLDGGYLSVRMKPSGDLLTTVQNLYSQIRAKELSQKISPEESGKLILEQLKKLGFESYDDFMSMALMNQLENRCRSMNFAPPLSVVRLKQMHEEEKKIIACAQDILKAYDISRFIPMNLEAHSAKVGPEGRQLAVVANQYQKMVSEINLEIGKFEQTSNEMIHRISLAQFYIGCSELMTDVLKFIEVDSSSEAAQEGSKLLKQLSNYYVQQSARGMYDIRKSLRAFKIVCEALQSLSGGLELIRMTGKVEIARMQASQDLTGMLQQLGQFQQTLQGKLREIFNHQQMIFDATEVI